MKKPEHHIFLCGSFRVSGDSRGVCNKKGSMDLMQYIEKELSDRGLNNVAVSGSGCLKVCDRGPAMVIYPENWWYGKIDNETVIDEILDALEEGKSAEKYILG